RSEWRRAARTVRWPVSRWAARRPSAPRSRTWTSSLTSAASVAGAAPRRARRIRPQDIRWRRVRRRGGVQQEGEAALSLDRFRGRTRHEELQPAAHAGRDHEHLLRVAGHGPRVADMAAIVPGVRDAAVSITGGGGATRRLTGGV